MSLKGGYQIIDLKFKPFDSREGTSHTFPELFNDLKNSNAKMIIISGLNMDGVKYNDYDVIFYEVEENNEPMYYQAVLRRIWTPIDYTCTTKYISIYNDDRVKITQDTFIYEILPDDEMSETSANALQNRVITQAFTEDRNRLSALEKLQPTYLKLDGSRTMTGNLNMGNHIIWGVANPTSNNHAANKEYVDKTIIKKIDAFDFIGVSYHYFRRTGYKINFNTLSDFSAMSIEIISAEETFSLDNTLSFEDLGLENGLKRYFKSNVQGSQFTKIYGSFNFPSINIFGTVESNGDYITIKFDGDITNIAGPKHIICPVPLVPLLETDPVP